MSAYLDQIAGLDELKGTHADTWKGISAEYAARMQLQNRFKTGLDIAQYTCLLYTSPSPRDRTRSRMPSSA